MPCSEWVTKDEVVIGWVAVGLKCVLVVLVERNGC